MRSRVVRLACLAAGLFVTAVSGATSQAVAFDWFEYAGRDAVFTAPLAAGQFRNPILAGFYPDPGICRAGDDFYLVNSSFAYFPGIPIFHSRDLVTWKQLGHVIDRSSQLRYDGLGVTRGIFAPALSYHDGTFYLVCTMVDSGGNFLVTATNPAGPWSDPIWLRFDGIDPSLFFDDDGRAWLVNNGGPPENKPLYQGHRAIWIQEFDLAARKPIGPRSIIINGGVDLAKKPVWIEGPHLYKRGGWYYLCCAEGGTSDQHSQVIFRSKSPTGPFIPWDKNPILTQRDLDGTAPQAVTCTGHADFVIGPDGRWWSVFLGCRPFAGRYWTTGRETFLLPVTWTADDWPVILAPRERVPGIVAAPKSSAATGSAPMPLTGNFTWRDEFDGPALSPLWIMLRTPKENWWSLTSSPRRLLLEPRTDPLGGRGNPSFLARRVQHARFTASTQLAVPSQDGVAAGLALFQNETHYFFLAARRTAEGLTLILECANGKSPEPVRTLKLPEGGPNTVLHLQLAAEDQKLSFAYATGAAESPQWQTLAADIDAMPITVQAAGGGLHFTGAVVGLHARREP